MESTGSRRVEGLSVFDGWPWAHPEIYTEAARTMNGCGHAEVCPFHQVKRASATGRTITVGVEGPSVDMT